MINLKQIGQFLKKTDRSHSKEALTVHFKDLMDMRRQVPYLKKFKFNQTSLTAGDYKSSFKGRGMEFEEVRAYHYGDDIRGLDWRVTARKNTPYTKLFAEEKDREVYVFLDLSPKMYFGTKKELKVVTAAKTAALIGWYALENKDKFGLGIFDGRKSLFFPAKRHRENLLAVFKKIESVVSKNLSETTDTQDFSKTLQMLEKKSSKHAIVFVLSSFEAPENNVLKTISKLSGKNDVYAVNVFDVLEQIAPPTGEYLAQYDQTQELIINSGQNFSNLYESYFEKKRQKIKNYCTKFNIHYREIRSDKTIYKQLKPI